jgi:uncharacterized membrane protein YkvI
MLNKAFVRRYLLPGLVFQSIVIAGGYGTGRELVEFFLRYGPLGGLLAMFLVNTVIWSLVCAVSFELARSRRAYDYRNFCRQLLGRAWGAYEVCYLVFMLIVLAVVAAAAGSILNETFGLPYIAGTIGMMLAVGFLVFKGSSTIEGFLSIWSLVLYVTYVVFCAWCFYRFGDAIFQSLALKEVQPGWVVGGAQYAAYNIGVIPAILFSVRHVTSRKEALTAGILAGPIGIIPGFLFFIASVGQYPEILEKTVPANFLLEVIGSRAFQITFQVVLLGTLIETGTGFIHAFNERVAGVYTEKKRTMPSYMRPLVAVVLLTVATLFAQVGLVNLIAQGYGTITWGFWLVYVIPVLTLGVWKIAKTRPATLESAD